MAKILLFVIEDNAGPGIRCLGSWLKKNGHEPILVFVYKNTIIRADTLPNDFQLSTGYGSDFGGFQYHAIFKYASRLQTLPSSFLEFCKIEKPDIIGFSTRFTEERFSTFMQELRAAAPNSILIAGGHGPSVETETFLDMDLDYVIRGEGEDALVEMANCVDAGREFLHIPNLAYKRDNKIIKNQLNKPIENLDDYSLPLRQSNEIYRVEGNKLLKGDFPYATSEWNSLILAGRGCIGSCSYCAAPMWRQVYTEQGFLVPKHRHRSNDHIIEEARLMKVGGSKSIMFLDDYFIRPYQEMIEFFNLWKAKINLPFYAQFSIHQFKKHPDLLTKAIEAGLSSLLLALQSADEKLSKDFFHRNNDNQTTLKFFREAFNRYVPISTQFIGGFLINGMDDLDATLQLLREIPFDPAFYYGTVIHSTKLVVHKGSALADMWPKLNGASLTDKEFFYRSMLMHFRFAMNDDDFTFVKENPAYKANPIPMLHDFNSYLKKSQLKYLLESSEILRNKDVYFFGCGEIYQQMRHIFNHTKPRAILVNIPTKEVIVDGLRVLQLEDVLKSNERIPIVIFSANAINIARKIKTLRPDYGRKDIIAVERAHPTNL